MPRESRPEDNLAAQIDKLKDPTAYKENFQDERIQQLAQAIDILGTLQNSSFKVTSMVGYAKLKNARRYLDDLLRNRLDSQE